MSFTTKVPSLLLCFIVIELLTQISGVRTNLYPFGPDERDAALPRDADDISSPEIRLRTPIVFYRQQYTSLYVNQNGFLSFLTEIPAFVNIQFPLQYPSIAPFYSDVDTRLVGNIFYRETDSEPLLQQVGDFLAEHFSSAGIFRPTSLFVATWNNVGSFDRKSDKIFAKGTDVEKEEILLNQSDRHRNTFQTIIATDGGESFAIFIYDKIEWIQGTGKNPNIPDAKAQAGLISGSGSHFSLKGSGTDQVSSLHKRSNSAEQGVWAFRIGRIADTVEEPDLNFGTGTSETGSSCAAGGAVTCHSKAECLDYFPGFCCKCSQGYYGNGKNCLENDIPQRATGGVRGVLNGIAIEDGELFTYLVPAEGRAYTAIARISERLGYDLQPLSVLGAIFGWLFSISTQGTLNGFQITGGVFNYTAEVFFVQTGHKVTINQAYTGLDVFDNLKVETRMHGTTAVVPVGTTIEVDDFDMLMTRVSPGVIRSKSNHYYRVEGTSVEDPFSIEQTINYEECPSASPLSPEFQTIKTRVARNYISYDPSQEIVRYSTTTTASPPDGEDPCKENRDKCGPFSSCVATEGTFQCICDLGYEDVMSDGDMRKPMECVDIDECKSGAADCDVTAHCINTQGSYDCICRESYMGDGKICSKMLTCDDVQCGENAHCREVSIGEPECACVPGYTGDGLFCLPVSEEEEAGDEDDCRFCDRYAECLFNPAVNAHICRCLSGYEGNGTVCIPTRDAGVEADCRDPGVEVCDIKADCVQIQDSSAYQCVCRYPFVGSGYVCRDSREPAPVAPDCSYGDHCSCPEGYQFDDLRHQCIFPAKTCEVDSSICDINAECVAGTQGYGCVCKTGFHGDGTRCVPEDLCRSHAQCGENGECAYNRTEMRYQCQCREGFVKDSLESECKPGPDAGCDVLNNCDVNGRCVWESDISKFTCECKPGFLGNGFVCQEDMNGCNVLNNCARNAECVYDVLTKGFRCRCREGFDGNGQQCRTSKPCYQDRTVCDINAECLPNQETREWKCQCKEGWRGDGYDCQEAESRTSQFLLVTKGMSLIKVMLDGGKPEPITVDPFQTAIGIDIDCSNEMVYWSDVAGGTIKSSLFNGSSKTEFLTEDIGSPEGLALDWAAQNLYWTDSSKDTIEVANLQTKKRKSLISTELVNPRGIAVYPHRGRVFWSDWNRNHPKIEYAGLDGMGRQVLVGDGLALPNSLTIDSIADQLCFADAGTHKIECIGIDGRNRKTFVSNVKYPFGLAMNSDTFYWSDWTTKAIESASRRTGVAEKSIEVPLGGYGKLYGLVLAAENCPQAYSPCNYKSCQDDYICLPNMRGGRSCRCTDSASSSCKDLLI